MKKKSVKKSVKQTPYHLLVYVENCETKLKKFKTTLELGKFIDSFNRKHPESESHFSGYWTDFAITGIKGDVHFFTDGMEVE